MEPIVYLTVNTGFLFTEMDERYKLTQPPPLNVVNPALYLMNESTVDTNQDPAFSRHAGEVLGNELKLEGSYELFVDPNADTTFLTGTGGGQIITAIPYALSRAFPNMNFLIVEKIPFFNLHRMAVVDFSYSNVRWQGFYNPNEIVLRPGEILIEWVTSPNNPNGEFRQPVTEARIILADFVFASDTYGPNGNGYIQENLQWIRKARNEDKLVLSLDSASKHYGRPGDRIGYMWYPRNDGFGERLFPSFILGLFLFGASSSTSCNQLLNFISLFSSLPERVRTNFFNDMNASLKKRYYVLSELLQKKYPGSTNITVAGSPTLFIKINDPRITQMDAVQVVFADTRTLGLSGIIYGDTREFVRFNLLAPSLDISTFANRLAGDDIYSPEDFVLSRKDGCVYKFINSHIDSIVNCVKYYVVKFGDCVLEGDTSSYRIVIDLPLFIGYEFSPIISIKKINGMGHEMVIIGDGIDLTLSEKEYVCIQWQNPLLRNGKWIII